MRLCHRQTGKPRHRQKPEEQRAQQIVNPKGACFCVSHGMPGRRLIICHACLESHIATALRQAEQETWKKAVQLGKRNLNDWGDDRQVEELIDEFRRRSAQESNKV